jgi:hypothetical protein
MVDTLNKHATAGSMKSDPTLDEVGVPSFRLARAISPECAHQLQFRMVCAGCERSACVASDEDHYRYCCAECVVGSHSPACEQYWPDEKARLLDHAEPGMIVIVPMKMRRDDPWRTSDDPLKDRRFGLFRIIESLGRNLYRGKIEAYDGEPWDGPELIARWSSELVWFELNQDQRESGTGLSTTTGRARSNKK